MIFLENFSSLMGFQIKIIEPNNILINCFFNLGIICLNHRSIASKSQIIGPRMNYRMRRVPFDPATQWFGRSGWAEAPPHAINAQSSTIARSLTSGHIRTPNNLWGNGDGRLTRPVGDVCRVCTVFCVCE